MKEILFTSSILILVISHILIIPCIALICVIVPCAVLVAARILLRAVLKWCTAI